jgi:hypothetical protein
LPGVSIWSLRNELGDHAELPSSRPEQQTNAHTQRSVPTLARLQRVPAGILGGLAGRIGPCRRGGSVRDRWPASPLNQRGGWRLVARTKKPRRSGAKFSKGEPASSGGEHDGRPPNAEPQSWLHGAGAARRSGGDHMERPSEHCRADYMTIVMSRRPPAATKPTPTSGPSAIVTAMPPSRTNSPTNAAVDRLTFALTPFRWCRLSVG